MKDMDEDTLLGRHLSGDPPREAFKEQVFRDSMAAFVRTRRRRSAWRRAELAAAAILIAGVAFLGGRLCVPRALPPNVAVAPPAVTKPGGVTVPAELVEWLNAARLFGRLGMEDRMARAVDRAGRLLPNAAPAGDVATARMAAAVGDELVEGRKRHVVGIPPLDESFESVSGVMAQVLGGYNHASGMD